MPGEKGNLLLCYNRGCGQTFDPNANKEDSCIFHSGAPFFHDAYKGWSCCKKKCTDFTEFLNIKGCTKSYHSNVKPIEPEKPTEKVTDEVIEYRAPEPPKALERPPFDSPLTTLKPEVAAALRQLVGTLIKTNGGSKDFVPDGNIPIGTDCKNNSCKTTYEGPQTTRATCVHHPGVPIFHEGLKYWSCCVRRTTDFNTFLEQAGCTEGNHVWHKTKNAENQGVQVQCRLDWHQTPTFVVVSVFAKKYDPDASFVQISPVRLKLSVFFPEENGTYTRDLELRGIVDVQRSSVSMLTTKVEIKLRKMEAGSWSNLDFPQKTSDPPVSATESNNVSTGASNLASKVDAVDLSDL